MPKKLTKKDVISSFNETCDYKETLCDFILTKFNKDILYDYQIPETIVVIDVVNKSLSKWKTKLSVKKDMFDITRENNEDSFLRKHMLFCDKKFCSEWFDGIGDVFKYRQEEKAKANGRIYACKKFCKKTSSMQMSGKKIIHSSFIKDIAELVKIMDGNIGNFYKKLGNDK